MAEKAVVATAKNLRKEKSALGCKACLGRPTVNDLSQPAPHAEANCSSAHCARCGQEEDHHDSACLSPTAAWPAFTEDEQASMEAGWNLSKGLSPSFWKGAKACTKAAREKREEVARQAERNRPKGLADTGTTSKTPGVSSALIRQASSKKVDTKFFTTHYPKITMDDTPKLDKEPDKEMADEAEMNSIVGLRLRNESTLQVKNAQEIAAVQTIKHELDQSGREGSQDFYPLRTTSATPVSMATGPDSRNPVFSNHYPLQIVKGVKLHHYTVVLTSKPKIGDRGKSPSANSTSPAAHGVQANAETGHDLADSQSSTAGLVEARRPSFHHIDEQIAKFDAIQAALDEDKRGLEAPVSAGSETAVVVAPFISPPVPAENTEHNLSASAPVVESGTPPDAPSDDSFENVQTYSGDTTKKASRAIKRIVVSEVLRQCPELKANTKNLATDFFDTIVSWMDVFPEANSCDSNTSKAVVWEDTVQLRPNSNEDKKVYGVRIIRQPVVNVDDLNAHVMGEGSEDAIRCNVEKTTKLLNIFVSRHVYQNAGYSEFEETGADLGHATGKRKAKAQARKTDGHTFKHMGDKYFATNSCVSLKGGDFGGLFSALKGFTTKVVPGMGNVYLNINVCASAFYSPMTVAEFLKILHANGKLEVGEKLLRRVRVYINSERKYDHLNTSGARFKTIRGFGGVGVVPVFTNDKTNVSKPVSQHLLDEHGWEKHADETIACLPFVNVGGQQDDTKVWYPADRLSILPYQRLDDQLPPDLIPDMIRFACPKPGPNRHLLHVFAREALGMAPKLRANPADPLDFTPPVQIIPGITATVYMAQHPAGRVKKPAVLYRGDSQPEFTTRNLGAGRREALGKWNLVNMQFHSVSTEEIKIHAIISTRFNGNRQEHIAQLISQLRARGMNVDGDWQPSSYNPDELRSRWEGAIDEGFASAATDKANLVILMPHAKQMTSPHYAYFKRIADVEKGLKSTCITQQGWSKDGRVDYMANVAMKINLKFPTGLKPSINHTVRELPSVLADTLILGADVTHPGANCVKGTPSIAAVIGSTDKYGCHYTGSMRLQDPETDKESKEVITQSHMQEMAEECLESYFIANGKLPSKILFYRDGVSQGAYPRFKSEEVEGVRRAYRDIMYDLQQPTLPPRRTKLKAHRRPGLANEEFRAAGPLITAIVGEKRHHTRFFPTGVPTTSHDNTPFGTFVESGPTSPYYYDFFLQAHQGIAGTVKPTHYFVVVDENHIRMDDLLKITNALCFVYQRATTPVSYAAPTYYADHLAERGRKYLKPFLDGQFSTVCEKYIDFSGSDATKADGRAFADKEDLKSALRTFGDEMYGEAKELVGHAAMAAFKEQRFKGHDCSTRGPWHRNLDDTMFWL
ncbi:hypothetical protein FKW77_005771 [Venturia effusa]|uniref:Piwi domain-containing protein n=1 Tax=Venturia effusa TaxID=50376 RepID=A0A517LKA2_9PEZI|nr:hypothetical protein FKW77_005771 [Venturia effusa]